ncbi:hypothetical protein [Candidatus Tisiphia endosymbiont of Dioctria rufipes]|uniref:hypothetical protein n=1 Tax=Candidatus Tisiphia endosymbiont of Dioctria rufipes TaxID=3066255 RepID=UPI00312CB573
MKSINANLQEIHIWSIDLNNYIYQEENLYNILTDDEHQRANTFTHKENKSFFVVTRGIVGKNTNVSPLLTLVFLIHATMPPHNEKEY